MLRPDVKSWSKVFEFFSRPHVSAQLQYLRELLMNQMKGTDLNSAGNILLLNKCKHVKHNNNAKWTGVCCKNCTNVNSILHHVSVISVTATELHHLSCAFVHRPHKLVDELHCKVILFIQHHQPQVSNGVMGHQTLRKVMLHQSPYVLDRV